MAETNRERIHELRFERVLNGKKERFTAIYNEKEDSIFLQGNLRYPLEIDELTKFLNEIKETETKQQIREGVCVCGSKNLRLVGKGIWNWAPLIGNEFDILQCESCGRQLKKITVNY